VFEGDIREGERQAKVTETVGDFMDDSITKPAIVSATATLRDAVDAILDARTTRKAYVVDESGVLKGTISIETLMRHVSYRIGARAPGVVSWLRFIRDMESDQVEDFMSKPVHVTKDTMIVDIVRRVVSEHLNDFPVLDEHGRLIGELNAFNLLSLTRSVFPQGRSGPANPPPG
jgi:CBS-domain-containing membrane protein